MVRDLQGYSCVLKALSCIQWARPHWGSGVNPSVCFGSSVPVINGRVLIGELWSNPALCTQKLGITCPAIWWVLLIRGTGMRSTFGVNHGYTCIYEIGRQLVVGRTSPRRGKFPYL